MILSGSTRIYRVGAPGHVSRSRDGRTVTCPTPAEPRPSRCFGVTSFFKVPDAKALLVIIFTEHFALHPSAKYFPIPLCEDVAHFNSPSAVAVGRQVWLGPHLLMKKPRLQALVQKGGSDARTCLPSKPQTTLN